MLSASCVVFVLISILCLVVAGKVLPGWLGGLRKGPVGAGLVCEKV
jgi:hypothetical protein